ncbi:unnamed protein product [Fraxinus pennsylvanica]|uniref:Uncharacterized protein n=1 Tax=Fraxinus pennsylvanica TaxID=56036 RepID=A0AAD2AGU2_9LAMI|nr:unnamed protein product [Fraxinus pennsylvanica]
MTTRVRWSSMPRVPTVQDEEDSDWMENGSEDTDGSLSADEDADGEDCRKRGPNHGSNVFADESGRISLTMGGNRWKHMYSPAALLASRFIPISVMYFQFFLQIHYYLDIT